MKRDMDLIRLILINIENDSRIDGNPFNVTSFDGYGPESVVYHFIMMVDAGLINGEVKHGDYLPRLYVRGLTYKGHDLIDAIREPDIWQQTRVAAHNAGAWTVDILKDLATAYIKAKLKGATGLEL